MLTIDQTQTPVPYGSTSTSSPTSLKMNAPMTRPAHKHIWIVTGPAGCGKTTVALGLKSHFNLPYIEGDEYHPKANIEKMAAGIPLSDADRWDWLIALREQATIELSTGAPGVVLTCSALKKKYRDVIRVASYNDHDVLVHFIYLHADEKTLLERVGARQGHYMKNDMVRSQLQSLEVPQKNESLDTTTINVSASFDVVRSAVIQVANEILTKDVEKQRAWR